MSLQTFKRVKLFTSLIILVPFVGQAWEVDLSRRASDFKRAESLNRGPASVAPVSQDKNLMKPLKEMLRAEEPSQEIVILNTEEGFVPSTVRLRKDGNYKFVVVNVNGREKNVSFIIDAFSEHHATYFGQMKTFKVSPKADGIFSFQSPETAAEGRIVVFTDSKESRSPAKE